MKLYEVDSTRTFRLYKEFCNALYGLRIYVALYGTIRRIHQGLCGFTRNRMVLEYSIRVRVELSIEQLTCVLKTIVFPREILVFYNASITMQININFLQSLEYSLCATQVYYKAL